MQSTTATDVTEVAGGDAWHIPDERICADQEWSRSGNRTPVLLYSSTTLVSTAPSPLQNLIHLACSDPTGTGAQYHHPSRERDTP